MRRFTGVVAAGLLLATWARPSWADQPIEVSEGEISFYLSDFTAHRGSCDAGWFSEQLIDTAKVTYYLPRETRVFTKPEYVKLIRDNCTLYATLKWDKTSFRSSAAGARGSGEWRVLWTPEGEKRPAVQLNERVDVVRHNYDLQITNITLRLKELSPGGEERFWAAAQGSGLLAVVQQLYDGIANSFRHWGKPKPARQSEMAL